ncbi:EAL domain-containing protein [Butyrivibrio sp. YAB3001]|uniref:EAL domain-containing protein n=1 Tax=Butyrivibrio sp. YAB3001 TaxID=1520812 RepID=UPI0008F63DEA|nr:EAL domain-containing protein [Butyrivibrio sp. YAB3001]SFC99869.1 EAL domain, c-di-GMP-specific phosphodiesterase class I (or its enzymatically inactive variant) [Butyrivibrio sp. YAB3001]
MFAKKKTANRIVLKLFKGFSLCALMVCVFCAVYYIHNIKAEGSSGNGKIVRVGWYESSYCYTDRFGRRTGMAYEYQQRIAAYTGWTYEYVNGTWPQLLQMLSEGTIDLLSDVSYRADRAQVILYPSLPMGTEAYYIYIKAGNSEITLDDISSFEGKLFAVNKGSAQENLLKTWAEKNGISINILEITDVTPFECINMLQREEIDVFVSMDTYGNKDNCVPICKIGSSDYYLAVNMDRPDLLRELNYAMTTIQNEDPYYNQKLYQKYIWSINVSSFLTDKELEWIDKHGTIRVGYRDNYLPFCTNTENGTSGALKDYLAYAAASLRNADIKFEAIPYKTTDDSLKALEAGEVDAVFPVSLNPYDSEELGLFATEAAMTSEIYAVINSKNNKDLFASEDITVALLEGNVNFDNFVKDYFPEWKITWYPTLEEVYKSVAVGKADCAMVNGYRINTNDRLRRKNNLSLLATGEAIGFSLAVKRENGTLFSILNKAVTLIDEPTVDTILSKYANANDKVSFGDFVRDNLAAAVASLAVIVSIILLLLLQKMKADKRASDRQKLISATELDPLTKLYTRNFFFEYANRMYNENPDYRLDAIVINIEQFHIVNALYGWSFGDTVLKALGDEIGRFIGENDGIACRSQADRFDIYCKSGVKYQELFDRFQNRINDCSQNINIRLRMGVMPWQEGIEPVQLFDRARTACGMIRGGLHSRIMVFNEEMREREILDQRLLNDLRRAVDNREFLVYYQPKYDVQVEPPTLKSAEALVRWKHHELGMIPPGEFISLFEKNGQIGMVDKYVWAEVARQIAEWRDKYGKVIPVSVNLSRVDIFDPDLENTIDGFVEKNGLKREDLHLEVTESSYTDNADQVVHVVDRLRNKGYHIEMDDFGTGYSSLNMLSQMPIDVLKLDRSFIKNIGNTGKDEKDIRMVELILDIAQSLKLAVVAEGVEDEKQLQFLKSRGCEYIQGYYFSPPLPVEEFEKKAFKSN